MKNNDDIIPHDEITVSHIMRLCTNEKNIRGQEERTCTCAHENCYFKGSAIICLIEINLYLCFETLQHCGVPGYRGRYRWRGQKAGTLAEMLSASSNILDVFFICGE